MTYAIQLTVSNGKKYFGYRNYKGAWTTCVTVSEATTFKTAKGAWRAIQNGDKFIKLEYACSCWQDSLQREGYDVDVVNIDDQESAEVFVEVIEQSVAEPVTEVDEIASQTIAPLKPQSYEAELAELRLKEDVLFAQALSSPQDEMLNQFQEIWTRRNEIYQVIENTMTPLPVQASDTQQSINYTVEEVQAIPKLDWYQMELWGKKEWQAKSQTYLCKKGVKLPESIIQQYKLTPRQVAILQQEVTLEGLEEEGNEDEPLWYDALPSIRDSGGYAYTARDIVMGRY